jgi:hypothetical protein
MVALRNIVNRLDKQSTVHFSVNVCVCVARGRSLTFINHFAFNRVEPSFSPDSSPANDKDMHLVKYGCNYKDTLLINTSNRTICM